jgi:hypothetical protein
MSRVKFSPFFVVCSTKEELSACWKYLSGTYGDIHRRDIDSRVFTQCAESPALQGGDE